MLQWIILAVIFFIIEILTPGVFFFSCLGVGAILGGLITLVSSQWILPWLVFIFSSVIMIYFVSPAVKRLVKFEPKKSNVDALIGREAVVTQEIIPPKMGLVKVGGELWNAESSEKIEKDKKVEIVKIEGTHVVVK